MTVRSKIESEVGFYRAIADVDVGSEYSTLPVMLVLTFFSMGTRDSCSQRMSIRDSDHQLFNFTYIFVLTWPRDHG